MLLLVGLSSQSRLHRLLKHLWMIYFADLMRDALDLVWIMFPTAVNSSFCSSQWFAHAYFRLKSIGIYVLVIFSSLTNSNHSLDNCIA